MTSVVVPIFNAPEETRRCLSALVAHTETNVRIVLVDDASTSPEIEGLLETLPSHWHVIRNEKNIGFVGSVNLGMAVAAPDDVVLLNADTEVTEGWLEALSGCLASDPLIASVSPLTNHGEIASIPEFCQANPYPDDPHAWAHACRTCPHPDEAIDWIDVPTTVGFCMLIRRSVLDRVGYFDEAAFGRGYGEENDWCQRALQAGFRHVLCDRAFVAHQGGASFGPLGLGPGGQAMATLLERYPNYEADVASFITEDPLSARRMRIIEYYQRLKEASSP